MNPVHFFGATFALAVVACSSSSTTPGMTSTGAAGAGMTTGATTTATTTGVTTGATGGATGSGGGTGTGGGAMGSCTGETPDGTTSCGAGKSCHLATCGPPLQYACVAAGTVAQGSACMTSVDCASGLTCIGYSQTLRVCEKQCSVDGDCPSSRCIGYSACSGTAMGRFCARPCTDVTAAGAAACGTGFKCDALCASSVSSTMCIAAGMLKSGTCMGSSDCAPGYTCINRATDGGVSASCIQLCAGNNDCTTGMCTGTLSCGGVASGLRFCM